MKHTPGPWKEKKEEQRIRIGGELITEDNGKLLKYPRQRVIGEVFGVDEEGLANARLIAAAPELLEACKATKIIVFAAIEVVEEKGNKAPLSKKLLAQLQQAIAKAEETS